ncbi:MULTISPECIES: anti-sigma factor [Marivita]|uniref:Regulator of SigK n=1 Tax=Marivita cryptomonadis TaxID=505252 RepID=A0A9Q2S4M3_9RHOB|nr:MULTISPECIES: anti-sigma factor [Marivita]MCR9167968.1 anti-sigma factor [Paracoccaceae bacterium]MBM2321348.1 anti-sigma factor [Marivita cryptomonadis]MBM2330929.1 anti-sigma factor [Marivita cryptomonadis]MBM2340515.1 anti-sigma factor [Marivita cryptomonadis]MBM2345177.1 anti-sigma factor [Marivita cryptomonadis]
MTDHTTPPEGPEYEDDRVLAAEYALGLLSAEERAQFEARLDSDADLRAEVVAWDEHFASVILDEIAPVDPSPQVAKRLQTILFKPEKQSFWQQIWPYGLGGVAAALVLWLTISTGVLIPDDTGLQPDLVAELAPTPDGEGLVIRAAVDTTRGAVEVVRAAGAPPEGRVFELWLIAGDAAPVSLGLLDEGNSTLIDLPQDLVALLAGALLAISDEPPGGSPTGAPTGAVRAAGSLTSS